jgi:hypothetical protein
MRCPGQICLDPYRQNVANGKLHECKFAAPFSPLARFIREVTGPPPQSAIWDRVLHFAAASDISLQAVASSPFYSIVAHVFGEGGRIGSIDANGIESDAFHRCCREIGGLHCVPD